MSNQRRSARAPIIADADEEAGADELNPFSFREFLRWKNQDHQPDQDPDPAQDLDQDDTHSKTSSCQRLFDVGIVTFDPEAGFFSEPSLAPQEEDDWGRSFQSGVDSTSSICTEEEEEETRFSSRPEQQPRGAGGGENYEGDDETSFAEGATSCRRRSGRSIQVQQLKEENTALRRTVRELQRRAEANEHRVMELSEELLQRRRQEEEEARDLESMVQSVEQNLRLMTKRAVKAENSVSKLRTELQQLQIQVDSLRSENHSLKAESEVVTTMRHNAQVASEYLNKTASHAQSSIRQLIGEAETLCLVSQLLQSIDKISTFPSES